MKNKEAGTKANPWLQYIKNNQLEDNLKNLNSIYKKSLKEYQKKVIKDQ